MRISYVQCLNSNYCWSFVWLMSLKFSSNVVASSRTRLKGPKSRGLLARQRLLDVGFFGGTLLVVVSVGIFWRSSPPSKTVSAPPAPSAEAPAVQKDFCRWPAPVRCRVVRVLSFLLARERDRFGQLRRVPLCLLSEDVKRGRGVHQAGESPKREREKTTDQQQARHNLTGGIK